MDGCGVPTFLVGAFARFDIQPLPEPKNVANWVTVDVPKKQ
jgi:hypothetical protein